MRGDDRRPDDCSATFGPSSGSRPTIPCGRSATMVDTALRELSPEFARLYAKTGRPSIPPEKLLRALLMQVLYSVRSERQLMEQLDYNLLFRWFVGLSMDDAVWDATVFTKNRERLLQGDVARAFFERVVAQAQARHLLSAEHFTVDGTLIEAWAGLKSFQRKDTPAPPPDDPGNPTVNFHGERRSNATHASTTDPEARLARKRPGPGSQARLSGPRPDGESPRLGGRYVCDAGDGHRGAGGGGGDGDEPAAGRHGRRGQGLRHRGLRRGAAGAAAHPACRAEHHPPAQCHRCAARRAMPATPSVSRSASASKRSSAGSRRWGCVARRAIAACAGSGGCSPSPWPCTTWCGSGT